ncbi:MAG TPA: molybdate ABC transporter substrate-binding protein [Rhizomicrobium sp.]|nr:molybdate ABC transporter substrate-binding protein [Rhizomicrobium sp.]
MFALRAFRAAITAAALIAAPFAAHAADLTVFAAASLTNVLQKAADNYKAKTGKVVALSFAASSVLAKQIEASGGADMFVSADEDWMNYLDKKGLIQDGTRKDLLGSHLVLIAPAGLDINVRIAPHFDLAKIVGNGKIAIADPASVPAGKYAKASLTSLGVWDSVQGHLASAENVRVALSYVARGEAPLGIVYTTDAMAEPRVKIVGEFPDSSHAPILYPIALTKDAKPDARAFLDFLKGPEAASIFGKAGFIILSNGH